MKFKLFVFSLIMLIPGWVSAQISGPDQTTKGSLAVFSTSASAAWSVTPTSKATGCFVVDSSGKQLFFASPLEGNFEIVCATVIDGEPVLYTFSFTNGEADHDDIDITPAPMSFGDFVKTELPKGAKVEQLQYMTRLFNQAGNGLKQGTMSVDQAFATIRVNGRQQPTFKKCLAAIAERDELKAANASDISDAFFTVAGAMKEVGENMQASTVEGTKLLVDDCETGFCPAPGLPAKSQEMRKAVRRW